MSTPRSTLGQFDLIKRTDSKDPAELDTGSLALWLSLMALLGALILAAAVPALAAGGQERIDVIVSYDRMPGNAEKNHAKANGAEVKRSYENFKMLALRVPVNALYGLSQGDDDPLFLTTSQGLGLNDD
jgi:hypothetical protein